MTNLRRILLNIGLWAASCSLSAQPYCDVRTLTVNDGLASTHLSGIVQTKDDLMWFASWNGLCCYDGYRFRSFRNIPGSKEVLTSNRLTVLEPSAMGNLWCTSYDRNLYLFDTHHCEYVNVYDMISKQLGEPYLTEHVWALSDSMAWAASEHVSTLCRIDEHALCNGQADALALFDPQGQTFRVCLDSVGREWVLTERGLFCVAADTPNKQTAVAASKVSDVPFSMMHQVGTSVFFATSEGRFGVVRPGGSKLSLLSVSLPQPPARINQLGALGADTLLAATEQGIVAYDLKRGSWQLYSVQAPGQPNAEVKRLFTDSRHRVWAFTESPGVSLLDIDKTMRWLTVEPAIEFERTESNGPFVYEDKYGTLWVAPQKGTFSYMDEEKGQLTACPLRSRNRMGFRYPHIVRTCFDRSGNLWFTGERDVSLLNFRYRYFHFTPVVQGTDVRSLMLDSRQRLWAGTASGHLAVFEKGSRKPLYLNPQGRLVSEQVPLAVNIYALKEDTKGRIWIGTKTQGIFLLGTDGRLTHFMHDEADSYSLSHNDIYSIDADSKGRILIGSFRGGLNIVDESEGRVRFINYNNELAQYPMDKGYDRIRRITHTADGVVLLSTNFGLITYSDGYKQPKNIKFYISRHSINDPSGLLANDVMQTLVCHNGEIYVVTLGGGVQEINTDNLLQDSLRFMSVSVVDANEVNPQSLVEGNGGSVWIVRESGIDRYDRGSELLHRYTADNVGVDVELSEAQPAHDSISNNIYLAASGGIVSFNRKELAVYRHVPNIVFASVLYHHSNLVEPILNKKRIEVPADRRALTVYFSTLDYRNKDQIRYAYMLEDMDDGAWTYIDGGTNGASFNYLTPGLHRLLVRCTDSEGIWQDNVKVLEIYVEPLFSETWMAKVLYGMLGTAILALAVFLGHYFRGRRKLF